MDRREAVEVLKTISELYPNKFEVTERKARVLVPELLKMDYSAVMSRLANYAIGHPFPPTISEIAVYPLEENEYLAKICKWEEEAASVPEETKHRFRVRLNQLVKEMSCDS